MIHPRNRTSGTLLVRAAIVNSAGPTGSNREAAICRTRASPACFRFDKEVTEMRTVVSALGAALIVVFRPRAPTTLGTMRSTGLSTRSTRNPHEQVGQEHQAKHEQLDQQH